MVYGLRVRFVLLVIGVANVAGLDNGLGRLPPLGWSGKAHTSANTLAIVLGHISNAIFATQHTVP